MKKTLTALFLFFAINLSAQEILNNGGTISVDTSNTLHPVIAPGTGSAKQDTSKRIKIWLEPGDETYTTDPGISHPVQPQKQHSFMIATTLYDTGKGVDRPSRMEAVRASNPAAGTGRNRVTELFNDTQGVRLNANIRSIVPGDTMAFAITYKAPPVNNNGMGSKETPVSNYKLYFLYNNNYTFFPLANNATIPTLTSPQVPFIRVHNNEQPISRGAADPFNDPVLDAFTHQVKFDNLVAGEEHTVFISMIPDTSLVYGQSGSVYAVLVNENNQVVASDSIPDMIFARAHDPNYIVQSPTCLLLPKKRHLFDYHVHFENTGKGDADAVRVVIQLPEGMDWSTFAITKAFFAGSPVALPQYTKDEKQNKVIVQFTSTGPHNYLKGVGEPVIKVGSRNNMGDIFFTIYSTPAVKDIMEARADIFFHSAGVIQKNFPASYEEGVRTNTAVSRYRTCCDCPPDITPCSDCCYIILGLCWWWWLIIIAALIIIIIIIVRKRKRRKAEEKC